MNALRISSVKRMALYFAAVLLVSGVVVLVSLHRSEAKKLAIEKANSSQSLVELLGQPIEAGWFVRGKIAFGSSNQADLTIPVSGPKGQGTLNVLAEKKTEGWHLTQLDFVQSGQLNKRDLLKP